MLEKGLLPNFSAAVLAELDRIQAPAGKGSAIDEHARHNTTSMYTAAELFPMLPEKLSNDLTSLNFDEERLAVVVEMVIGADGSLQGSDIYRARVRNHAKLAYDSVAAWLEGNGAVPEGIAAVNGLAENLRVQDRIAQSLRNLRHVHGALSLETIEAKPIFDGDQIRDLEVEQKNRAKELIEDFMIAANGVTARYLAARNPLRSAVWCARPNAGTGLSSLPRNTDSGCPITRLQQRWMSFWSRRKQPIGCNSPTSPSR
jgi:exoribonuclease-2